MMNERLRLARQLLKEDGVIFVSIDDAEQAYLKILMDEIFGEENFVCNFVWQKKNEGSGEDTKYIKILNEYILMYSKNIKYLKTNTRLLDTEDGSYNNIDRFVETRGKFKLNQLDRASLSWSKNLDYIINFDNFEYYAGGSKDKWLLRQNGEHAEKDWQWRWSKEKVEWGIKNDFLVFKNKKVYTKQYQFVDNDGNKVYRDSKFSNLVLNIHGSIGTSEQKNIFNKKIFDHPKPTNLIKFLINLNSNKNAKILDFFAGSGTTGHAVLELNKEDNGNRTFTLVTSNQNNIAININYERLFRINNGFGTRQENFVWSEKNDPYKSNLQVFNIKYQNINPFQNNNNFITNKFNEILSYFNIKDNKKINEESLLRSLSSLKIVSK